MRMLHWRSKPRAGFKFRIWIWTGRQTRKGLLECQHMTQKRRQVWRYQGYPGNTVVKNPLANAGDARDVSLIPGSERFPGVGNGNPLQYTCLGNPMDKVRWATVHGVTKRQTWLSNWACTEGGDNLENGEAECSPTGVVSGRRFKAKRRNLGFSQPVITKGGFWVGSDSSQWGEWARVGRKLEIPMIYFGWRDQPEDDCSIPGDG